MFFLLSSNNNNTEIGIIPYSRQEDALLALETAFLQALPAAVDQNTFPKNLGWRGTDGWFALLAGGGEAAITESGASVYNADELVYWQVKELQDPPPSTVFSLFSTRTYENGEHYEGVDGIYATFDLAQAEMEKDFAEQRNENSMEEFSEDYCEKGEAKLVYGSHEFKWEINEHPLPPKALTATEMFQQMLAMKTASSSEFYLAHIMMVMHGGTLERDTCLLLQLAQMIDVAYDNTADPAFTHADLAEALCYTKAGLPLRHFAGLAQTEFEKAVYQEAAEYRQRMSENI